MAITTIAGIESALADLATTQTFYTSKASLTNQSGGVNEMSSSWTNTGFPAAGAIPSTAEVCHNGLLGAIPLVNPASGNMYLAKMTVGSSSGERYAFQLADRLMHMGGLSSASINPQTVNLSLDQISHNFVERMGAADYSDVEWWIESYAQAGATPATLTITYTNAAGTSGQTLTYAWPATYRARRMSRLLTSNGERIKSIESCQFSVTTSGVGGFGFTATRPLATVNTRWGLIPYVADWQELAFPRIYNSSCLQVVIITGGGATLGICSAELKIVQG